MGAETSSGRVWRGEGAADAMCGRVKAAADAMCGRVKAAADAMNVWQSEDETSDGIEVNRPQPKRLPKSSR